MAAELLAELQASEAARELTVAAEEAAPLLRQLLEGRAVRPPYGGHPRIFIWGLLEARLQRADLVVLGGLNEGVWPALPAPDPWLPPKIRAALAALAWAGSEAIIADSSADRALSRALEDSSFGTRITADRSAVGAA